MTNETLLSLIDPLRYAARLEAFGPALAWTSFQGMSSAAVAAAAATAHGLDRSQRGHAIFKRPNPAVDKTNRDRRKQRIAAAWAAMPLEHRLCLCGCGKEAHAPDAMRLVTQRRNLPWHSPTRARARARRLKRIDYMAGYNAGRREAGRA